MQGKAQKCENLFPVIPIGPIVSEFLFNIIISHVPYFNQMRFKYATDFYKFWIIFQSYINFEIVLCAVFRVFCTFS